MLAVLGAGIMGCCLALELSSRGHRVVLLDRAPVPMTGASLHNEGKLHLGFVYASDPLKATHALLARGSLTFTPILERLTGQGPSAYGESLPFHYFVPKDSQLGMAAILEHFCAVENAIQALLRHSDNTYLGRRHERYHAQNSAGEHKRLFSDKTTLGSIRTEERSVSPAAVANILRRAIASDPQITFIGGAVVESARRLSNGSVEVEMTRAGVVESHRYAAVANCLWDDRLRVDHTAGIHETRPWLFRYKATIRITAPGVGGSAIPSATGIIGPYGDVVNHNDGSFYLSWYPTCKRAQTAGLDGRALHDAVHQGALQRGLRAVAAAVPGTSGLIAGVGHGGLVTRSLLAMADYVPALAGLLSHTRTSQVGGGVIYALGSTDIDDTKSILHQRSRIGPAAYYSYITVDTGKYGMAPMFAVETADLKERVL